MHNIEMQEMSEDFLLIWHDAADHLLAQTQDNSLSWLRAHPNPPYLEHLSFRIGNQLFYIRVVDVDGVVDGPGSVRGLLMVAEGTGGHPCLLPMRRKPFGRGWVADRPGWGLIDAGTKMPVDPLSMVSSENIEMTAWELHDMAVQVVRSYLEESGRRILSWQSNPGVDPALWFIGGSNGPEWIVIRHAKYPEKVAARPPDWETIKVQCEPISLIGHFASVSIASGAQPFFSGDEPPLPIFRGHAMEVNFDGFA